MPCMVFFVPHYIHEIYFHLLTAPPCPPPPSLVHRALTVSKFPQPAVAASVAATEECIDDSVDPVIEESDPGADGADPIDTVNPVPEESISNPDPRDDQATNVLNNSADPGSDEATQMESYLDVAEFSPLAICSTSHDDGLDLTSSIETDFTLASHRESRLDEVIYILD